MDNRSSDFASNLRMYRARADLSQQELGALVGVDYQSIGNWENGTYMPSLRTSVRLADALGVTLDQLVGMAPA